MVMCVYEASRRCQASRVDGVPDLSGDGRAVSRVDQHAASIVGDHGHTWLAVGSGPGGYSQTRPASSCSGDTASSTTWTVRVLGRRNKVPIIDIMLSSADGASDLQPPPRLSLVPLVGELETGGGGDGC